MKRTSKMIKAFHGASLPLLLVFALTGSAAAQVCVAPPSGLVSWWPGDGNASDIQDGNHGTLQNGATFAAGKVGQAFSFDGVDDSVDVADNSNLNPGMGSFTVDAWVFKSRLQSDFAVAPVIAKHVGDFRNGYYLGAGSHGETGIPNNEIEAVVGDGDGNRVEFGTGVHVPLNVWFHLAMSYDNSTKTLSVYRDGALISSGSNLFIGSVNPSGQIFRIGSYNRTTLGRIETFPGVIDEVEFFNRALSASEIQAIFNAGSAGKCKGAIEVAIDIKPGSFPNSLNPRSKGVIPVAILTTDSFDATTGPDRTPGDEHITRG